MRYKACTKCGDEKPLGCFNKRSERDSYRSHCKSCTSQQKPKSFAHAWYQERFSKEELELFSNLKHLCTKARLRKKDFDPDVDWEYLFDIWVEQNGQCRYSGMPLSTEANHPHKVSLDRINSDMGYVKGNVQLVSASVNRMKQEFSEDFFLDLCASITTNNFR